MFENTPRMVCLPEPGSMWTPSHIIQASSCGLDCIEANRASPGAGGNSFSSARGPQLLHPLRMFAVLTKSAAEAGFLADWPPWAIVAAGTLLAALLLWLFGKVVKVLIWILIAVVLVGGVYAVARLLIE